MYGIAREIIPEYNPEHIYTDRSHEITVVIPAHNSEHRIGAVIRNLEAQRVPPGWRKRVLVCANACTDNTAAAARKALHRAQESNCNITYRVIETPQPGEPLALNTMVAAAENAEIIVGLNDDVFPTKSALMSLYWAMLTEPDLGAISVRPRPLKANKCNYYEWFVNQVADYVLVPRGLQPKIIGRMFAFRPESIGLFPDIISEDSYLMYQSLRQTGGYGEIHDGHTYVYNRLPRSLSDIIRQNVIYRLGTSQIVRLYSDFQAVKAHALPQAEQQKKKSLWEKARNHMHDANGFTLSEKFTAKAVLRISKAIADRIDETNPPTTSQRPRIMSAV